MPKLGKGIFFICFCHSKVAIVLFPLAYEIQGNFQRACLNPDFILLCHGFLPELVYPQYYWALSHQAVGWGPNGRAMKVPPAQAYAFLPLVPMGLRSPIVLLTLRKVFIGLQPKQLTPAAFHSRRVSGACFFLTYSTNIQYIFLTYSTSGWEALLGGHLE